MPLALFGGLMVNPSTTFVWLRWIQWISPIRYCFESLTIAQWETSQEGQYIYQELLGFGDRLGYWKCISCMAGLIIFFRVLSVLALKWNIKRF